MSIQTDITQASITDADIQQVQTEWAAGIVEIGRVYQEGGNVQRVAQSFLDRYYAFDAGDLPFKPTMAVDVPFRPDAASALSYFIGGIIEEDKGFAIKPWQAVRFETRFIRHVGGVSLSMGHYYFTPVGDSVEQKVEFTFVYQKDNAHQVKILLHHSSLPAASSN